MKTHARTIQFLKAQQSGVQPGVSVEEVIYTTRAEEQIACDIYNPPLRKRREGTILFLHGMSPLGHRDPRQVNLLRSLSLVGFRVVSPLFDEIREAIITSDSITKLEFLIAEVCKSLKIKKIALFSASFSGSICMCAAARDSVKEHVSAICTVGSFSDISSTLEYLFTAEECDSYARLIILKNFIEIAIGKNDTVKKALTAAIHDNWHKNEGEQLDKLYAQISNDEKEFIEKLLHDSSFRNEKFLEARKGMVEVETAYDMFKAAKDLQCTVTLFHGHKDTVIHPEQSLKFFHYLQELKVKSTVCISPFLSHGEATISLRLIKSLFKVIQAFSFFFKSVRNSARESNSL